ncbi:class I SAM-dependent methyltransferase [Candidatus Pacearchaeota archaeon]|nr:class I SAM-dependent methyltransferase [Candidatus Pacearchaeota archaeon]
MNYELSRFIEYLPKGATICDLGAGEGETAAELTLLGFQVTALDNNLQALATLKNLPGITVVNATLPEIPLKTKVDAIWCANTLPWLSQPDQQATITEASRSLKPNGIFYCSTRSLDPRGKESMLISIQPEKIKEALLKAELTLMKDHADPNDPKWHHWFARKR